MKTLIIYAHPYEKSFNHAILQETTRLLVAKNEVYEVIDLYNDEFNPAFTKAELALYREGKALDPLVLRYQDLLKGSKRIIFIFPIWWYDTPAIVKGFFDKVMLKKFSYLEGKQGPIPQLTHIEEALIITTSMAPTMVLKLFCGNAINRVLIKSSLKGLIGKGKSRWLNFGGITDSSASKRQAFLDGLARYI